MNKKTFQIGESMESLDVFNGRKWYEFGDSHESYRVRSSYVQLDKKPDEETLNKWFSRISRSMKYANDHFEMHVFLIFILEENITYEYQITESCIKENIHYEIVSLEKDIMPRIEKRFSEYWINLVDKSVKIRRIIETLCDKKMTIATMESCTGGQLASDITSQSGASEVLRESYVTYCNDAKIKFGVPKEIIEQYSVYSYETAVAMAKAVSKCANANIGIGVTGQLGRIDPNNPGISDNQIWYAINVNDCFCVSRKLFILENMSREEKKRIVTREIIDTLEKVLSKKGI